jgi:hypothetical protein
VLLEEVFLGEVSAPLIMIGRNDIAYSQIGVALVDKGAVVEDAVDDPRREPPVTQRRTAVLLDEPLTQARV